jgi:iron complex outermembrane recepter protein
MSSSRSLVPFDLRIAMLLLALAMPQPLLAQTGSVGGTVRAADGMALRGVQVVVEGTDRVTSSTTEGHFLLVGVPVGTYVVTASSIGYMAVSREVEVRADRVTRLEITLSTRAVELGGITVLGTRQYGASTSETALKMDAHVMETPASVTVITEDFLHDQGAVILDDLFRNVAGITPFSDYQDFTARGFRQGEDEVTYNGVRSNPNNFFASPNLQNIERVEILKGPASVLYGSLEGGAMINIVTKSPRVRAERNLSLSAGSYNDFAGSADLTGPVMGRDNLLYRVNVHHRNAESFRLFQTTVDWNVAPSLTWRPGQNTSLTLKGEYVNSDRQGHRNRGIGAPGGDLDALPISWTANEPTDIANQEAKTGELNLQQGLWAGWRTNASVRYTNSVYINQYHEPLGFATVGGRVMMRRQFRDQAFRWKNWAANASLIGDVRTGPLDHRLHFGGDYTFKERLTSPNDYASPVSSLDVFNPQYGQADIAAYPGMAPDDNPFTRDYKDWGVNAQNLITLIPQVKVLVGGRYSNAYVKNANFRLNTLNEHTRTARTYRAGLVLQPLSAMSIYGNYSEGFKPQTAANETRGGPFDPLVTRQNEGGVKFNLFGDRLIATSSAYRITKHNVLVPDPDPTNNDLIPLGEVKSEGWEFDVVGSITPQWSITANYANNHTVISADSRPAQIGSKFPNAPKNAAALWTRYDFSQIRLGIAGGLSYVDERGTFDATVLPSYTVYDGALFYEWNRYRAQLNVKNLLNDRYFSGGYNNYTLWPGAPRSVQLTVRAAL